MQIEDLAFPVPVNEEANVGEAADIHGWADKFAPFALSLGSVDNQLYSLPDEMETLVLYYNKTLFEDNGWTPPTTMDELHALSAEIDEAGVIPFGHANADWRPANEWFVGEYLNHVAGPDKVYQALTGEVDWTDPDFVLAIEMLNEAQQNGWYMAFHHWILVKFDCRLRYVEPIQLVWMQNDSSPITFTRLGVQSGVEWQSYSPMHCTVPSASEM